MLAWRAWLFGAAMALGACQVLIGLHDEDGAPRLPDAEAPDADLGDVVSCRGLVPPDRPLTDDPTIGDELVLALSRVSIRPSGQALGYNLDDRCTSSENRPCLGSPPDDDGGIDDSFAQALANFPFAGSAGSDPAARAINDEIATGQSDVVIVVNNWSYAPNDREVKVTVLSSPGCVAEAGPCASWHAPLDLVAQKAAAPIGYVSNGTLVARFDRLVVDFAGLRLVIDDAVLTADLAADGGSATHGVLTGRMNAEALIEAALHARYRIGAGDVPQPLCKLGVTQTVHDAICSARDLPAADPAPSAKCTSVSLAVGFEAIATSLGDAAPPMDPPDCGVIDASCP